MCGRRGHREDIPLYTNWGQGPGAELAFCRGIGEGAPGLKYRGGGRGRHVCPTPRLL